MTIYHLYDYFLHANNNYILYKIVTDMWPKRQ